MAQAHGCRFVTLKARASLQASPRGYLNLTSGPKAVLFFPFSVQLMMHTNLTTKKGGQPSNKVTFLQISGAVGRKEFYVVLISKL